MTAADISYLFHCTITSSNTAKLCRHSPQATALLPYLPPPPPLLHQLHSGRFLRPTFSAFTALPSPSPPLSSFVVRVVIIAFELAVHTRRS